MILDNWFKATQTIFHPVQIEFIDVTIIKDTPVIKAGQKIERAVFYIDDEIVILFNPNPISSFVAKVQLEW